MTNLEIEDVQTVAELPYDWSLLTGKTLLISGGTGFIGSFLSDVVRYRNRVYNQNIKIIALSRHGGHSDDSVRCIKHDVCLPIDLPDPVDYILHLASNTHPRQYREDPVGTIMSNVLGTYNLLELATRKSVKKVLLASSCEIYGECDEKPVDELFCGYLNPNTARAGYNEAKRVSEALGQSFLQQHGVPFCVLRLARVFGADKTKQDTKAMAQFIRNAVDNQNIVLKSKGTQKYSFIYIADAAAGLLKALFDGEIGEAYNLCADNEDLTLGQYAEYVSSLAGKSVIYDIENDPGASAVKNALLDNTKIKKIGFRPSFSVKDGIKRTYLILKESGTDKRQTDAL